MGKHTYLEALLVLPKLKCKFERRRKLRGPNYAPINIGASMGKHTYLEALLVLPKLKCKFERRRKLRGPNYAPINIGASMGKLLFKLYRNFVMKAKNCILNK